MRAVCLALGVSRSHVLAKKHRSSDWADRRKSPPRADETYVKQAIADVVQKRATYGYRRVWARLKLDGHTGINGMAESVVKTLKREYTKLANRPDS